MNKKIKWTAVAVLLFVLVFMWGRNAEAAEVGIGLGWGVLGTRSEGVVTQELMLKTNDYRWYVSYARIGANQNDRLQMRQNDRFTAGYQLVFRRGMKVEPYMMLGMAYFEDPPMNLISERLTYDMRLGVRIKDIVELELDGHNSTASRSDYNSGMDVMSLRAVFRF